MTTYSLLDVLLVWIAGMIVGGFFVRVFCNRKSPISKEDAYTLRHILSYCELTFKAHFRNGFPIENDPTLSVRFPSWAGVNVFVKKMIDVLGDWK